MVERVLVRLGVGSVGVLPRGVGFQRTVTLLFGLFLGPLSLGALLLFPEDLCHSHLVLSLLFSVVHRAPLRPVRFGHAHASTVHHSLWKHGIALAHQPEAVVAIDAVDLDEREHGLLVGEVVAVTHTTVVRTLGVGPEVDSTAQAGCAVSHVLEGPAHLL